MYEEARATLKGTPLARHSMNQRVMKRVMDGERALRRHASPSRVEDQSRPLSCDPLLDAVSLDRLLRNGIYRSRLEAAIHAVGSHLGQIDPARWR